MKSTLTFSLLLLVALTSKCLANPLETLTLPRSFDEHRFYQQYHALSDEVETPHLTWGKSSVWQGLRVLVIAPSWGQRETVELRQRFDFQVSSLMTLRHNAFAGLTAIGAPLSAEQVTSYFERDLLEKQYDIIIVSRTGWGLFPSQYRYDILRKVHDEGCGLLLINVGKHDELEQLWKKTAWKQDLGIKELNALRYVRNGEAARTQTSGVLFGKGRVMRLEWRSMSAQMILTPWPGKENFDAEWEYDHYLAITTRAILACSGKFQDFLETPTQTLSLQSGAAEQKIVLQTVKEIPATAKSLELVAFSANTPEGRSLGSFQYHSGQALGGLVDSDMPEGEYLLLALSRDAAGRLCSYQYFPLRVTSPLLISSLNMDKDAFAKAGETVEASVQVAGAAAAATLLAQVYDINSRLLIQQRLPIGNDNTANISFPAPEPLNSGLFRLQVSLDGKSRRDCSFTVQGRQRPVFSFGAWVESQTCYVSHRFYDSMAANGIDGIFYSTARGDRKQAAHLLAKTGLFSIPHFYHYAPDRDKSNPELPVNRNNLNDEKFLAEQREKMLELAKVWAKYDIHSYTDGSDKSRGGNSFDPVSKERFRSWMESRHANVEAMNQKLGSSYRSFAELEPQPLELAREKQALPLWLEYNRFFEERFLNYFTEMLQAAREADLNGEAYLGPDGFGRLDPFEFSGIYELLQTVNYYNLYTYQDPPQMEIGRSLLQYCPNVKYRTIYAGSYGNQYMNYEFMRTIPWFMLFHDYTGFFWYMGNGKLSYSSEGCMAFMPDLRPSEGFLVSAQQIDEMRRGMANLVAVSKRQNDRIALLYCNTSVAAATVDKQENALRQSLSVLQQLLEDSALQYDYIPPQEVESGNLKRNYSVLFLPFTLSLAEKTLAAIEEFVQGGGLVIADRLPGKYNDFLRPGPEELLAKRFQADSGSWRLSNWKEYSKVRNRSKAGNEARRTMLDLLAGYRQSLTSLRGDGIPGMEKIEYQLPSGDFLVAVLNYQRESHELTLELPSGKVLYDVRDGKALGQVSEHSFTMPGGEVKVFALLQDRLPEATLESPSTIPQGGEGVFRLQNGKSSNAYHLSFFDSSGKERREYRKTVLAGEECRLQPALNDPTGTWTLQAKDVIAGKTTQVKFQVKDANN